MTADIFADWVIRFDRENRAERRKVALVLDNYSSHVMIESLTNTKVFFLPPNTTSVSQPMDAGIIKNLKVHYRNLLLQKKILGIEFKPTLIDALSILHRSWGKVTSATVQNCFRHVGFTDETVEANELEEQPSEVARTFSVFCEKSGHTYNLDEFIDIDEAVFTVEEVLTPNLQIPDVVEDDDDDDDDEVDVIAPPTITDCVKALTTLDRFIELRMENDKDLKRCTAKIEEKLMEKASTSKRQTSITNYCLSS